MHMTLYENVIHVCLVTRNYICISTSIHILSTAFNITLGGIYSVFNNIIILLMQVCDVICFLNRDSKNNKIFVAHKSILSPLIYQFLLNNSSVVV